MNITPIAISGIKRYNVSFPNAEVRFTLNCFHEIGDTTIDIKLIANLYSDNQVLEDGSNHIAQDEVILTGLSKSDILTDTYTTPINSALSELSDSLFNDFK